MAKIIKYYISTTINLGTSKKPEWSELMIPVNLDWNENNEKIAMRESHNGKYTIEDDGYSESTPSQEERIVELEEALELLLSEATE